MAVGVASVEGQERCYGGRISAFVVLSCMTAGGTGIGMAGGVSSMEPFLRKFFPEVHRRMRGDTRVSNHCKFDSQLLTAFTSSLYVAGLLTTFLATRVTAGRPSMILGGAAFLSGAAVCGASVNIYTLILGRVLLRVGLGSCLPPLPAGWARWRRTWSTSARRGSPAAGDGACRWRSPRSSRSAGLVQQGRDREDVAQLLQKIHGADVNVADIVAANGAAAVAPHPASVPAAGKTFPFFQLVTGINAIAFYTPVLLRSVGMGESAALL
ncbi:hypothetical protein EJB05_44828, partial [Eragrostis curvula]